MNMNTSNTSMLEDSGVYEFVRGAGRLFYVINPKEAQFQKVEEVPNFYVQSWPYFFMFMLLEHIVLKLEGKSGIRLNDGITSLSNGLFLESGRLIWRGAESYAYAWIYSNYRVLDLEWDSTTTWVLAALGIDFCYYWMHRACHEVHILWAQHQVHHTSEDFNMGVGIRQSALQGWCGFIFYLPLALAIPPAQFVMHHQFSYLYMFWIHTEAVRSLGPLEYVLNTPSHHRVHHGSNPSAIDVNYGGVLIIWDKLFGTYQPESNCKTRIVYGLIFNEPSFNPLHLQTFYTKKVWNKFRSYDNWLHKFHAVFNTSSWKPGGYVLFKNLEEDPAIQSRVKYDVVLSSWCVAYLLAHYSIVLFGFYELFLMHLSLSPISVLIFVAAIIGSLTIFGMILDAAPQTPKLETIRCITLLAVARWILPLYGVAVRSELQLFLVSSAVFWFMFVFGSVEMNVVRKGD